MLIDKVAGVKKQYTTDEVRERVLSMLNQLLLRWIVREGSCPIDYRLLLLLENSYEIEEAGEKAEMAIEHACACIIALSEDLTDKGIVHHIGWWDKKTQSVCTVEIQSAEDLLLSLGEILAATLEERKRTIWERFQDTCEENRFAQIIVIDDETAKKKTRR